MAYIISHNSYSTWLSCQRRFYFYKVRGLSTPTESHAAAVGTLYHHFIERWGMGDDDPVQAMREWGQQRLAESGVDGYKADKGAAAIAQAVAMATGALEHAVLNLPKEFEPEVTLSLKLPGEPLTPRYYMGRLDGVMRSRSGGVRLLEVKTSAELSEQWWERMRISNQILGNQLLLRGAHREGLAVEKPVVHACQTTKHRINKHETLSAFEKRLVDIYAKNPDYYATRIMNINTNEVLNYRNRVSLDMTRMTSEGRIGFHPNTNNCKEFMQWCPYLGICDPNQEDLLEVGDKIYEYQRPELPFGGENDPPVWATWNGKDNYGLFVPQPEVSGD